MRTGRLLLLMAALMMVVSCGKSPEQKEVDQAFNRAVDAIEARDAVTFFGMLSENTRDFLDLLAMAMNSMGVSYYEGGADLIDEFFMEDDMAGFSRSTGSITVEGDVATLRTGPDILTFRKEGEDWKLDLEELIREGFEEGLEGSGITIDDILEGTFSDGYYETGEGSAPVSITNGLESWAVYYVYVAPSESDEWGEDRLGMTSILQPYDILTVWVDPGTYDMMVVDEDDDSYTLWEVEVGPGGVDWYVTLEDLD